MTTKCILIFNNNDDNYNKGKYEILWNKLCSLSSFTGTHDSNYLIFLILKIVLMINKTSPSVIQINFII